MGKEQATDSPRSLDGLARGVGRIAHRMGRKASEMPKKAPWHSTKQSVHHNNTKCTEGNNIETVNKRDGTGGKPLCDHCSRLNARGE